MSIPSLLEATFLHAQGIGRTTEYRLWEAGVTSWERLLDAPEETLPLGPTQCALLKPVVEESQKRLEAEDFAWFAERLPTPEHWRAVPAFGHRLAFVDIETNGGMGANDLTLIGVFDGFQMKHYIKGVNLEDFPESLSDAAVLVTFFGTGFDLPFIRRVFPNLPMPQMHVDLCYLLKRLGYKGGLKSIEQRLGISRSTDTTGMSGLDAIHLWNQHKRGNKKALETLLAYNAEDVKNLSELLSLGYRKMAERALAGEDFTP